MKMIKKINQEILIIVSIIICVGIVVSLFLNIHTMNKKIKQLEFEKALILSQKSEIEIIKETFDKNKEIIKKSKETIEKVKKIYEQSVWLDRCLSKKMLGEKEDCSKNLERFAVFQ